MPKERIYAMLLILLGLSGGITIPITTDAVRDIQVNPTVEAVKDINILGNSQRAQ